LYQNQELYLRRIIQKHLI